MLDRSPDPLDALLDRQKRSWLDGGRPSVEELLAGSSLHGDSEAQLDLVYNEIVVREEIGESPSVDEYARRFPHLRDDLALHFEVHLAVRDRLLEATDPLAGPPPAPDADADARPAGEPLPPDYEPVHLLGQGGMGIVYKARHRHLRRHVALKMFKPGRLPSPREVARFQAEAEAVARLQHPNVVQIFEVGRWNGLPYLALELAEGGTLADRLQKLPFTPRAAAELVETLARAVHHAHERGIVHRDLKPANVLFAADGTPKVADFGLARVLLGDDDADADAPRDMTRTGEPIGTPRYMAPEQAEGRPDRVGPATDVHALGAVLYECLTGRVPFAATSVVETLEMIRRDEPQPPRRLQPKVPRDLETVCLHCLQKDPGRRYPSALALADDLHRFAAEEPVSARPTPAWERAAKWCRRRPTHAALIAVAVLLLAGGTAAAGYFERKEQIKIAQARRDVEALMTEGQASLARGDDDAAQNQFRGAWELVQGEPALNDYRTGVSGWLDHGRRAADRQRWKQRVPPREYDELRDEAHLRGLLLDLAPGDPLPAARDAVRAALDLTVPGDPAWQVERERLFLLDADLLLAAGDAAAALARLDEGGAVATRPGHERRATLLDTLGRSDEATRERLAAGRLPPDGPAARFAAGADAVRRRDFAAAARDYEAVLDADPEHASARLFLAVCHLHLGRTPEAVVGLTAAVAQRPLSAWGHALLGQAWARAGDSAAADRAFRRALDRNPPDATRQLVLRERDRLHPRTAAAGGAFR